MGYTAGIGRGEQTVPGVRSETGSVNGPTAKRTASADLLRSGRYPLASGEVNGTGKATAKQRLIAVRLYRLGDDPWRLATTSGHTIAGRFERVT